MAQHPADANWRLFCEQWARAAWLLEMGLAQEIDTTAQLPARAETLTPARRNAAAIAEARAQRICRHCHGPAAGWTLVDDGSPDTRVPLCEMCEDDAWQVGQCSDPWCGRPIGYDTCAAIA